jgi:hypothetical protein
VSFVYILTNEAMPGIIKIGMTTAEIENRMLQLDTTGVPLPFECYYAARVNDQKKVEKALHEAFGDHRVRKTREFFRLDPYKAKVILELVAEQEVTPKSDVVADASDEEALVEARKRRARFTFSSARVPIGATLTFSKGDGYTAIVVDDSRVDFRGEITSLSASAQRILKELGYSWVAAQGPAFWLFEGETLDDRRRARDTQEPEGTVPHLPE